MLRRDHPLGDLDGTGERLVTSACPRRDQDDNRCLPDSVPIQCDFRNEKANSVRRRPSQSWQQDQRVWRTPSTTGRQDNRAERQNRRNQPTAICSQHSRSKPLKRRLRIPQHIEEPPWKVPEAPPWETTMKSFSLTAINFNISFFWLRHS